MNFEQEVLWKLGRLEERSETQTKLLEALNRDGCAQGHADRERMAQFERDQAKLWKYSRAMSIPRQNRRTLWTAIGTVLGGAAVVIAQWWGIKYGGTK